MESLCSICRLKLDITERRPVVGKCGHSVCSVCIKSMDEVCPFCRSLTFSKPATNFQLIDIMEYSNGIVVDEVEVEAKFKEKEGDMRRSAELIHERIRKSREIIEEYRKELTEFICCVGLYNQVFAQLCLVKSRNEDKLEPKGENGVEKNLDILKSKHQSVIQYLENTLEQEKEHQRHFGIVSNCRSLLLAETISSMKKINDVENVRKNPILIKQEESNLKRLKEKCEWEMDTIKPEVK